LIHAEAGHGLAVCAVKQSFVRCDDDDEVMDATLVLETDVLGINLGKNRYFADF
tara:strand:+ start:259829 stop:259990 length:162 start_codon:yes stop_codon:yes gene_type:complete